MADEKRNIRMHTIDRKHPEYAANCAMWQKYRDLYAGGEQLKHRASEYLVRRHKEPAEIYSERLNRVFYENYIGSIIDWYAATLLRREPVLLIEGSNEKAKSFFNEFAEDCDLKGSQLLRIHAAAVRRRAGIRARLRRSGFSAGTEASSNSGGIGRAGTLARIPGRLHSGRSDQLVP